MSDRTDEDALTVDPHTWLIVRIVGRNPLLRRADRIEAFVIVLALVVSLVAIPVAGVVAASVYSARWRSYDQQAQTRHTVTATVVNATVTLDRESNQAVVQAKWSVGADERSGSFEHRSPVKSGDRIQVWVDSAGNLTPPPIPTWRAVGDAVLSAMTVLLVVGLAVSWLRGAVRSRLNRTRDAQWEHEIACLEEHGGRTNWH
ncbi:Rv1733c family protein [Mycobacterium angelicum]|uniref:Uncharacterized protein n=1 Tax=Mycobacterium angelicum TaxID=470074 RepID=A0A1W9ZS61_MYCAN|nr:hypothetical protein [Mycobacterium angelicum]MCV7199338.1 hypothetical protein [Mycobacterium angelicum]ORA20505.1 hypothetical protein BST12_15220 [Mycobacterium angelicum]